MDDSPDDDSGDRGDGFPRSGPGPAGGDESVISRDALYEILSKRRCRLALSHLEATPVNVVELDDLAEGVTEREAAAELGDGTDDHRQQVAVTLHHRHLPMLSNTALLDYDGRSKTVRYRGDDRVASFLDATRSEDDH